MGNDRSEVDELCWCHVQTTAGLRRQASAAAASLGTKQEVNAERRAASEREYKRMARDGAPPDAKCALLRSLFRPDASRFRLLLQQSELRDMKVKVKHTDVRKWTPT